MGRPPKAREIKALEGNRAKSGKKAIPPPVKLKGVPIMPTKMIAEQRNLWNFVITAMPVDLLKKADSPILERFVRAWWAYGRLQTAIDQGKLWTDEGGETGADGKKTPKVTKINPLIKLAFDYAKEMDITGQQLGLSPVARARLQGSNDTPEEDDIMDALLGSDGDPNGAWFTEPSTKQ